MLNENMTDKSQFLLFEKVENKLSNSNFIQSVKSKLKYLDKKYNAYPLTLMVFVLLIVTLLIS